MTTRPKALQLADEIDPLTRYSLDNLTCSAAAFELRRLHEDNENLRSVMIAAAEEIDAHWDAHCDVEGYGPVNLMHRLERGIPSEYGYKAGDFERLRAANIDCVNHFNAIKDERDELLAVLKAFSEYVHAEQSSTDGAVTYSTTAINHWAFLARAAINKAAA
jgi:hypothetical protein